MDKNELLEALEDGHQEMLDMLDDLSDEMLLQPGVIGEWSIKDILAHLTYWEGQVVTLIFQAQQGMPRPSTAHFSKTSVDELNQRWYLTGKDRSLEMIWQDWQGVRKQTIRRVSDLTQTDLNDIHRYAWLGDEPLYQWILRDTIEHEDEHAKQILEWLDQQDVDGSKNVPPGPTNGAGSNNGHN